MLRKTKEKLYPKVLDNYRGSRDRIYVDTIIPGEANLGSIFEAISDEHVGNRGQHC